MMVTADERLVPQSQRDLRLVALRRCVFKPTLEIRRQQSNRLQSWCLCTHGASDPFRRHSFPL
jgi:hypothetical protein